ncbi:MAG: DoxX family protein [Actinomycetota bacterium]|nr:DoxX family protein [Actinomycetota bacterium]
MTPVRGLCGCLFILSGMLHFLKPRTYEAIMPPYIPAHREMVLASGAAEIAGGVGVLVPGLQRPARWGLLALLVAVFPVNVHMAVSPDQVQGLPPIPRWVLWARLPFQVAFAALVTKATSTR